VTFKLCKTCRMWKRKSSFGPFKSGKDGLYPTCKVCKNERSKRDYAKQRLTYKIYCRAKSRAKKKGLEFTIKESDILIPELCPIFKVPMVGKYAPSLDRIDSALGYTPDNIQVISNRANVLKNNASIEEIKELLIWMLLKQKSG
jgi:hypothetical protein